ncbi:MAG: hypothetical protein ACRDLU_00325 [Gaiellaceae bacterium]
MRARSGRGRLRGEQGDRLSALAALLRGGWSALADRPSTPKRQPRRLPAEVEQEILAWRAQLRAGRR